MGNEDDYRLSVEELALALSLTGLPETGHALLLTHLGSMEADEANVRLNTAGHSLYARGWLILDENGDAQLDPDFAEIVSVLGGCDFSVRYSRTSGLGDSLLTYHFNKDSIYEHSLQMGVVHHIRKISSIKDVVQGGREFFEMNRLKSFSSPRFNISYELMERLGESDDLEAVRHGLEEAGVPNDAIAALAQDLVNSTHRGTALRIDYPEDDEPCSDRGFFTLETEEHMWFVYPNVEDEGQTVEVASGSKKAFKAEVEALITQ